MSKRTFLACLKHAQDGSTMDIDIVAKSTAEALEMAKNACSGNGWIVHELLEKVWSERDNIKPTVRVGDTVYFETFKYRNGRQESLGILPHEVTRIYKVICVGNPKNTRDYCEIPEWSIGKDVFTNGSNRRKNQRAHCAKPRVFPQDSCKHSKDSQARN